MTAGAVGRERRDESALHQIDQHRREPGLDDVRADAPDDAGVAPPRVAIALDDALQIRGRRARSAATSKKALKLAPRRRRPREVLDARLARRDFSG